MVHFHQSTWKSQDETLMGTFNPKDKMYELQTYVSWEWRMMQSLKLSFENWHQEFDKFWPGHSKVSKMSLNELLLIKLYIASAKKGTEKLSLMS